MNAPALDLMLQHELPAAADGSQEAYGRIVLACQNTVTAIALAITRDVQASEDIAQEAFLRAWQQLDRLHNAASFLPWLRQITRNLARDYLRAHRGRPLSGETAEIAIGMAADPAPTPSERLLRSEEEIVAAEIISALPEDSRETLLLYYREGQRSQHVADLLGLSDAAVRKRLSRARATVREEMLKRFGEFARSSAPGAAFAMMVVGGLVGAMPAASAASLIGSGILGGSVGKLGTSGLMGTGVSGSVAGGSVGVLLQAFAQQPSSLFALITGMVAGLAGYVFTWWYLLRFCETAQERVQIRRFLVINSATAAAWLLCVMLAALLSRGWLVLTVAFVAGVVVLNSQYLVALPKIMAPMLARPANAHRRRTYNYVIGPHAVVISTLMAAAALVFALVHSGRI